MFLCYIRYTVNILCLHLEKVMLHACDNEGTLLSELVQLWSCYTDSECLHSQAQASMVTENSDVQ